MHVDEMDLAIVEQLRRDGRATNQQIAEALGVTAQSIAASIKRLEDSDQMRVIAVSDFAAHGFSCLMRVAVGVERRAPREVAEELAQFPEALAVHLVSGRAQIDMLFGLQEIGDLKDWLYGEFARIDGIRRFLPAIVIDVIKYRFDVAPIGASAPPLAGHRLRDRLPNSKLDQLDFRLIEALATDARVTNHKIAMDLQVTEGTIRSRIKRLQQDKMIAFTAVTSFDAAEKTQLVFVSVEADVTRVREVARQLARIPLVNAVMITSGVFNIAVVCLGENAKELLDGALASILRTEGVHRIDTAFAIDSVKHNYSMARIDIHSSGD